MCFKFAKNFIIYFTAILKTFCNKTYIVLHDLFFFQSLCFPTVLILGLLYEIQKITSPKPTLTF